MLPRLHTGPLMLKDLHSLVFPRRRVGNSWVDTKLQRPVEVDPTHWQQWTE